MKHEFHALTRWFALSKISCDKSSTAKFLSQNTPNLNPSRYSKYRSSNRLKPDSISVCLCPCTCEIFYSVCRRTVCSIARTVDLQFHHTRSHFTLNSKKKKKTTKKNQQQRELKKAPKAWYTICRHSIGIIFLQISIWS